MKSLSQKIKDLLISENYTFRQLADYLNLSEAELESGLEDKTLEIRYLEEISKNLKVPLYSIFRDSKEKKDMFEQPFFTNKLWKDEEENNPEKLVHEIKLLKQIIAYKEAELSKISK
jgi:transcriptional regulator with XRE-family HTH domain